MVAGVGMSAFAQNGPVKFGVKAGATFPNFSISGDASGDDFKTTTSFYVGGTVTFPVSDRFSLQSGLSFIGKGTESDNVSDIEAEAGVTVTGKAKINPLYLELPVNAIVNFEAGNGKFFVGAGPYVAMGIAGKVKVTGSATGNGSTATATVKEDIKFGTGDDDLLKRGDFGLNFLAGYELNNGFNIQAGYGLGLSNLLDVDSNIASMKNRVLSIGVGYSF